MRSQPGGMSPAEATPAPGFCPHPLPVGGRGCGRLAWQGAAMLWHRGQGAARRVFGEPQSRTAATEQAGVSLDAHKCA